MKTCVFAGTFDPFTKGHEKIVETCLSLFDEVVVAVGVNAQKKPLFTTEQRVEIIRNTFEGDSRVKVDTFDGLLVDYMKKNGYEINVRGVRNETDYKYENEMAIYNSDMYPNLKTLFIPSDKEFAYINSSALRALYASGGDFSEYLPEKTRALVVSLLKENLEK